MKKYKKKYIPALMRLIALYPQYNKKQLYAYLMAGAVYMNSERINHVQQKIPRDAFLIIKNNKYVSRGGDKLAAVLPAFPQFLVQNKIIMDVGASTGGFSDCLLHNGASMIYTIDVGYNQLAYSLRNNPRINIYEKYNIMDINNTILPTQPHLAVVDLSFRSICGAIEHIISLCSEKTALVLMKPQFEYAAQFDIHSNFSGIISDNTIVTKIFTHINEYCTLHNLYIEKSIPSPIKGRKGNQEYFLLIKQHNL